MSMLQNDQFVYWAIRAMAANGEKITIETIYERYNKEGYPQRISDDTISNSILRLVEAGVVIRSGGHRGKRYEHYAVNDEAARKYFSGHKLSDSSVYDRQAKILQDGLFVPVADDDYQLNVERFTNVPEFESTLAAMLEDLNAKMGTDVKVEDILSLLSEPVSSTDFKEMIRNSENYVGFPRP